MQVDVLDCEAARLGECPVWCERTERLWWVDVLTPALWSHDPKTGTCSRHKIKARRIGSLALRRKGGLLLACDDGLYAFDPQTGQQDFLIDPEPAAQGHRKNDGRADWAGNFWIGTLREDDYAPIGSIYRVTPDLKVTTEASGLSIPNALAFDLERRRMYYADTRTYTIWVRAYDAASNHLGKKRIFAKTTEPARPDGSCIDAEGHVWNAEYAGGRLVRYDPEGKISRIVELPVSHPTCCCFGGPTFDRLYVTSAREPLSEEQRQGEPLAGLVLSLDVDVNGRPEFRVGL